MSDDGTNFNHAFPPHEMMQSTQFAQAQLQQQLLESRHKPKTSDGQPEARVSSHWDYVAAIAVRIFIGLVAVRILVGIFSR